MTQEKIREASNVLQEASASIEGAVGERLQNQADELSGLAERDREPDHGRIARHQQKLKDIKEVAPAAAEAVDEANERLSEYRETVEGV